MPYVCVTAAKKLNAEEKESLYKKLGELMPLIPGKTLDNTLLAISDGVPMYKSGAPCDGAHVSVQCYKASPPEAKKEFAAKFYGVLKEELGLGEGSCVYMNFPEFEDWAANGNYF